MKSQLNSDLSETDVRERLAEAEKLLRFYADRRAHSGVGVSAVYRDAGDRARRFIGVCETCNGIGGWCAQKGWVDPNVGADWVRCRDCNSSGVQGQGFLYV